MKTYKRRFKKRGLVFLIIILLGIAFFITQKGTVLFSDTIAWYKLKNLHYDSQSIKEIVNNDLENYLIDNKIYSKTLEVALTEGNYKKDYLDTYLFFEYKDYDKYVEHLNGLKDKKYANDEINVIFEHLTSKEIDTILEKDKIINLGNYITDAYFKMKNVDRYVAYKEEHPSYKYETVVTYVNTNLDYKFYEHIQNIIIPDSTQVLVNKYYKLSPSFVPKNLVSISSACAIDDNKKVASVAKKPFEDLCNDMRSIGLTIKAISTYRSYNTQQALYNEYVQTDGVTAADTYSARPGHSEHQTGLAIDAYNTAVVYTEFNKTSEYAWLRNNAHKYGFIIRYQQGKENITGYKYEPWHLRYIGEEIATYIYQNNITLDEYYAKFIYK